MGEKQVNEFLRRRLGVSLEYCILYLYAGDRQNQLDLCGLQEYFLNKTYKSAREQVQYCLTARCLLGS